MRLKAKDFSNPLMLHSAAEKIVAKLRSVDFSRILLSELVDRSALLDGDSINRFGWLFPADVEVLSAIAIPIGEKRDPFGLSDVEHSSSPDDYVPAINTFGYFILGIAIAAIVIIIVLLYLHFRLRQEYALLAKDKSSIAQSSETLRKLWSKFATFASKGFRKESKHYELSKIEVDNEQRLSNMSLMKEEDENSEEHD